MRPTRECETCGRSFPQPKSRGGRFCSRGCTTEANRKGMIPKPDVARFEALFIPEPNSGCWLWEGTFRANGYGQFKRTGHRLETASRSAWYIYRGDVPQKIDVCHKCDNPACVNPDHLFLGSRKDNMQDMIAKGRQRITILHGETNPSAKLNAKQVDEIRSSGGVPLGKLAALYGVSKSAIWSIRSGKSWTAK